jgi:gamma-glutamyltranspeptidase/glutathione hydrolase
MAMRSTTTGQSGGRPQIMATRGVVSSGHYLATQAGLDILKQGGNAADAAAATGLALTVLKPHQNGFGGEVPILIYSTSHQRAFALSGHGVAPRAATLGRLHKMGLTLIPGDGLLPALVPPAPATWILLLEHFGTLRLCDVLEPVIELAAEGFPMYQSLRDRIALSAQCFREEWPSSAEKFLVEGAAPPLGTVWKQRDLANTFADLAAADRSGRTREDGLRRALTLFYDGAIAEAIVDFFQSASVNDASGEAHGGLLTREDFSDFEAKVEDPVSTTYRGLQVLKCDSWTQGPVLLQSLNLLQGYDLRTMGHNTVDYIHTVVECMKLAYADREFYYGDPAFVDVPLQRLLSAEYAERRRRLIDPRRASLQLRPGGFLAIAAESVLDTNAAFAEAAGDGGQGDTTKLEVIDRHGNVVSATPSGGWLQSSPVVPGLGFPLGTRGQMFSLAPGHPNCLAPGKRPRTTLTPSLALRQGKPYLSFGSPGGDKQDQWALQFLLNVVEFGMSLQEAVEAATFWSEHWPSSFYPREATPGGLSVEGRVATEILDELANRGHRITVEADWSGGNTLAAAINADTGVLHAAASPRLDPAYAAGW